MCRVRWLEKAECVSRALCRVQCNDFTHKSYMKTKIVLSDSFTVLSIVENDWRSVLKFFNAVHISSVILDFYNSSVSLVNAVEVKRTRYIFTLKGKPDFPESYHLSHPGIILAFQQLRSAVRPSPLLCDEMLNGIQFEIWVAVYLLQLKGAYGIVMSH